MPVQCHFDLTQLVNGNVSISENMVQFKSYYDASLMDAVIITPIMRQQSSGGWKFNADQSCNILTMLAGLEDVKNLTFVLTSLHHATSTEDQQAAYFNK